MVLRAKVELAGGGVLSTGHVREAEVLDEALTLECRVDACLVRRGGGGDNQICWGSIRLRRTREVGELQKEPWEMRVDSSREDASD